MSKASKQKPDAAMPLTVAVEGDVLCIRIGVGLLAWAVQNTDGWPPNCAVADVHAFARDVARELGSEEEDGTTPVHRMLDAAADSVSEGGDESVVDMPVSRGISLASLIMKGGDA